MLGPEMSKKCQKIKFYAALHIQSLICQIFNILVSDTNLLLNSVKLMSVRLWNFKDGGS